MILNYINILFDNISEASHVYTQYLGIILILKFIVTILIYGAFFFIKSPRILYILKFCFFFMNSMIIGSLLLAYYYNALSFLVFYTSGAYMILMLACFNFLNVVLTQQGYSIVPLILGAGLTNATLFGFVSVFVYNKIRLTGTTLFEWREVIICSDDPVLLLYSLLFTVSIAVCSWVPLPKQKAFLVGFGSNLRLLDQFIVAQDQTVHAHLVQMYCTLVFSGLNMLRLTTSQQIVSETVIAILVTLTILSSAFSVGISLRILWHNQEALEANTVHVSSIIGVHYGQLVVYKFEQFKKLYGSNTITPPSVHYLSSLLVFSICSVTTILF